VGCGCTHASKVGGVKVYTHLPDSEGVTIKVGDRKLPPATAVHWRQGERKEGADGSVEGQRCCKRQADVLVGRPSRHRESQGGSSLSASAYESMLELLPLLDSKDRELLLKAIEEAKRKTKGAAELMASLEPGERSRTMEARLEKARDAAGGTAEDFAMLVKYAVHGSGKFATVLKAVLQTTSLDLKTMSAAGAAEIRASLELSQRDYEMLRGLLEPGYLPPFEHVRDFEQRVAELPLRTLDNMSNNIAHTVVSDVSNAVEHCLTKTCERLDIARAEVSSYELCFHADGFSMVDFHSRSSDMVVATIRVCAINGLEIESASYKDLQVLATAKCKEEAALPILAHLDEKLRQHCEDAPRRGARCKVSFTADLKLMAAAQGVPSIWLRTLKCLWGRTTCKGLPLDELPITTTVDELVELASRHAEWRDFAADPAYYSWAAECAARGCPCSGSDDVKMIFKTDFENWVKSSHGQKHAPIVQSAGESAICWMLDSLHARINMGNRLHAFLQRIATELGVEEEFVSSIRSALGRTFPMRGLTGEMVWRLLHKKAEALECFEDACKRRGLDVKELHHLLEAFEDVMSDMASVTKPDLLRFAGRLERYRAMLLKFCEDSRWVRGGMPEYTPCPYDHMVLAHALEMMARHGSIGARSCEPGEALNKVSKAVARSAVFVGSTPSNKMVQQHHALDRRLTLSLPPGAKRARRGAPLRTSNILVPQSAPVTPVGLSVWDIVMPEHGEQAQEQADDPGEANEDAAEAFGL
jgi:hypothetical protein